MYRQIELHPKDRNLHQLYWRREGEESIEKYRMTRAIYGIAYQSDTIMNHTIGWIVSDIADIDHTVTIQKHSSRYGINFLDS